MSSDNSKNKIYSIDDDNSSLEQKKELERYRKYLKSIKKYDPLDEEEYLYLTNEMTNIIHNNKDNFTDVELLELTQKLDKIELTEDYTIELLELTKEIKKIISPQHKYDIPKIGRKENPKKNNEKPLSTTAILPKIKQDSKEKENPINEKKKNEPANGINRKTSKDQLTLKDLVDNNNKNAKVQHFDTVEINKIRNVVRQNSNPVKPQKKKDSKLERIIWTAVFICSVVVFLAICGRFLVWELENRKVESQIASIYDTANIVEVVSQGAITDVGDLPIVIENEPSQPQEEAINDYWYYMSMSMLNANFDELKRKNSDTAGWIQVAGTNINYPYVQTVNNEYYLKHSFDGSYNGAGWVFLDYRNDPEELGKNNILYAHGRLDNTMFGSLKVVVTPSWYNNSNNYVVKTSTPTYNALWQVFSVYTIEPESYYIRTKFTEEEFATFMNTITSRSVHDFGVNTSVNDKILTLSSCYDSKLRVVLHAKLIRLEEK